MNLNTEVDSYKKIVRLSDEELKGLWEKFYADRANKIVRDKLIEQYIYLVRYVVGRVKVTLPQNFTYEDVVSFGAEGLIDAVEKFLPNKGAKFESYAIVRIRGNIIDKVRDADWLPRTTRRKIKEVKVTAERLKQQFGRAATNKEIADVLKVDVEKIDELMSYDTSVDSLYDTKGSGDDSMQIIDTLVDNSKPLPDEVVERQDSKQELQAALKKLPERERMLLVLYYHENMTLKEIGAAIKVSESRVCQLHAQAIMKLRNILSQKRQERMQKSII